MPPDSEGINAAQPAQYSGNLKPIGGPKHGGDRAIVKAPTKSKTSAPMPMQYSSHQVTQEKEEDDREVAEEDEDVQTFLNFLSNSTFHASMATIH